MIGASALHRPFCGFLSANHGRLLLTRDKCCNLALFLFPPTHRMVVCCRLAIVETSLYCDSSLAYIVLDSLNRSFARCWIISQHLPSIHLICLFWINCKTPEVARGINDYKFIPWRITLIFPAVQMPILTPILIRIPFALVECESSGPLCPSLDLLRSLV